MANEPSNRTTPNRQIVSSPAYDTMGKFIQLELTNHPIRTAGDNVDGPGNSQDNVVRTKNESLTNPSSSQIVPLCGPQYRLMTVFLATVVALIFFTILDHGGALADPGSHRVNTDPQIVSGDVAITSTPVRTINTYAAGETIEFPVPFDTPVVADATNGTPRLLRRLGATEGAWDEYLNYASGSGGTTLVFQNGMQAADSDDDGIFLRNNGLFQNGGTIRHATTGRNTNLNQPRPGNNGNFSNHKVDVRLTPKAATIHQADTAASEHQVASQEGDNTIKDTVTQANSSPRTDTVAVVRAASSAARPPGQVTRMGLTPGNTQLTVSWTAVGDATGYKVQWRSGNETFADAATDHRQATVLSWTTTSHTITGLTNNTSYTVRVLATKTGASNGTPSVEVTASPGATPPEQVTGIDLIPGNTQLTVSWTAVGDATGYKVQWRSGNETFAATDHRQATVSSGTTTSHTITGLTNNTSYTVRVLATKTGASNGTPSVEVTASPGATPPEQVTGIDLIPGNTQLTVSWTAVSGATGYKVQWRSGNETFADVATDHRQATVSSGITTSRTISGLTNGTTYTVRVLATKIGANDGTASMEVSGIAGATFLNRVTRVSLTPSNTQLTVSWTAVSGATGYKVQWRSGNETFADVATDHRQATVSSGITTSHTISGLTNGTTYTVRVLATKTGTNDGAPSVEVSSTPAPPPPGQVTGVSLAAGNTQLTVNWTVVSGATGYKVQWRSGNETFADAATVPFGTTTSHTISGLTNNTSYTVRVLAIKTGTSDGTPSVEVTASPGATPPGQVTGVRLIPGNTQLTVNWTAVSGATGYKVQWRSGNETFADVATAPFGTTTSHTISGLTNNTSYTVRVLAIKTGTSDGTPSVEVTASPGATPPEQVTGVRLISGNTQLTVNWTVVSGATGYKVQWRSGNETFADAATDHRQATVSPGTTTSHTISGLTNNTSYTVRVLATKTGTSDGTPSVDVTGTSGAMLLNRVMRVTITADNAQLTVNWTVVSGATGYKVQWRSGNETLADAAINRREATVPSGTTTSHTITGLTNGISYTVRVLATKPGTSVGAPSVEVSGTPAATPPEQVTGIDLIPGNTQLTVSWTAVSDATGYRVQWRSGNETFADAAINHREAAVPFGTTTSHTITDLTNNTSYTVRVLATKTGASAGAPSVEVSGAPGTMLLNRVMRAGLTPGNTQLTVKWTAVSDATGYKVQWRSGNETFADAAIDHREATVSSGTTTRHTITGLTNGTTYTVRVLATKTGASAGAPSVEVSGAPAATPPGQVTGVGLTTSHTQLAVNWTAVSDATGYKVQWRSGNETFADAAIVPSGTMTRHTITGLTNGTSYTVRVLATKTGASAGAPSVEVSGTPTATPPGQVTGVGLTTSHTQLAVNWTAVSDATGYKVQWRSGNETFADAAIDHREATVSSGTTTRYTITGLTNGTTYTVRVLATKTGPSAGAPSVEVTGSPAAVPPGRVTEVSLTTGNTQLMVKWTAVSDATGYKMQWRSSDETFADAAIDHREATVSSGTTTRHTITGLTNGTTYTVRVLATKTGAGDGAPSVEVSGTPAAVPPGRVTEVSLTTGNTQLTVKWTAVSDATGYKVQWRSSDETFADDAIVSSGTTTRYTITGLTNGTTYTVRVLATKTGASDGALSVEVSGTPAVTPPGRVTEVSLTTGNTQLTVKWTAVSDATGYKVQWRSGDETFADVDAATDHREAAVSSGPTTRYTITGLTNGTTYTVRVLATKTGASDGAPSVEVSGTPASMPPGRVTGIGLTTSHTQLTVSWTAVSGATGYKVQWRSGNETFADAATDHREATVSSGTTTRYTITGLTNGTTYTVRVLATKTGASDGAPSVEVSSTPRGILPGQVTKATEDDTTVDLMGNTQIKLCGARVRARAKVAAIDICWKVGSAIPVDGAVVIEAQRQAYWDDPPNESSAWAEIGRGTSYTHCGNAGTCVQYTLDGLYRGMGWAIQMRMRLEGTVLATSPELKVQAPNSNEAPLHTRLSKALHPNGKLYKTPTGPFVLDLEFADPIMRTLTPEMVQGLEPADFEVTNGTVTAVGLWDSGTYQVAVTPTTLGEQVTIKLPANKVLGVGEGISPNNRNNYTRNNTASNTVTTATILPRRSTR